MKKIIFSFALLALISIGARAQKNQIQNTSNALRFKELDKAKTAIDLAAQHPETKDDKKMWFLRGKTYLAIHDDKDKYKGLDPDAAEKALESFINAIKLDKEDLYGKESPSSHSLMVASALRVYNKGMDAYSKKDFEKAAKNLSMLFDCFPLEREKALQRSNINPETLNYELYNIYWAAKDNAKAKEHLQKLIDIRYKNPDIYLGMSRILLSEKDTAGALKYIEQGRNLFDDNQKLITAELNLYIQQKKTDQLIEKLNASIESAPDNELLYYTRGLIYRDKKQLDKAEADYKKVIELKADHFDANFELGALYFNRGVEWNNKAGSVPLSEAKKAKEYDEKAAADFKAAIPYLEKAHELNANDLSVIRSLKKLYGRTGEDAKFSVMKEKEDKLTGKAK